MKVLFNALGTVLVTVSLTFIISISLIGLFDVIVLPNIKSIDLASHVPTVPAIDSPEASSSNLKTFNSLQVLNDMEASLRSFSQNQYE